MYGNLHIITQTLTSMDHNSKVYFSYFSLVENMVAMMDDHAEDMDTVSLDGEERIPPWDDNREHHTLTSSSSHKRNSLSPLLEP